MRDLGEKILTCGEGLVVWGGENGPEAAGETAVGSVACGTAVVDCFAAGGGVIVVSVLEGAAYGGDPGAGCGEGDFKGMGVRGIKGIRAGGVSSGGVFVAGGGEDSDALEVELEVFVALAVEVVGREVGLGPGVRDGDDLWVRVGAAVEVLIAVGGEGVGVYRVEGWVEIGTVVGVVGSEHGVERAPEVCITNLDVADFLRPDEGHSVLEVEVRLHAEYLVVEVGVVVSPCDALHLGTLADHVGLEVGEEVVHVLRNPTHP